MLVATRAVPSSQEPSRHAAWPYRAGTCGSECRAFADSTLLDSSCLHPCDALAVVSSNRMPRIVLRGIAEPSTAMSLVECRFDCLRMIGCKTVASEILSSPPVRSQIFSVASTSRSLHISLPSRVFASSLNPISQCENSIVLMGFRFVHSLGQPINSSTHIGFNCPPATASDNCPRLCPVLLLPFQSVAQGVGSVPLCFIS